MRRGTASPRRLPIRIPKRRRCMLARPTYRHSAAAARSKQEGSGHNERARGTSPRARGRTLLVATWRGRLLQWLVGRRVSRLGRGWLTPVPRSGPPQGVSWAAPVLRVGRSCRRKPRHKDVVDEDAVGQANSVSESAFLLESKSRVEPHRGGVSGPNVELDLV